MDVRMTTGRRFAGLLAVATITLAGPTLVFAQEMKVDGMIIGRDGDMMLVRTTGGVETKVKLSPGTQVVSSSGALGLQRDELPASELLNGLPVTVEGVMNGTELDAHKVSFKSKDLKTAQQVSAGTEQARARVRAKAAELDARDAELQAKDREMRERLSNANQYVEKGSATVLFPTGSAVVSAKHKAELKSLASRAQGIKGYLIGVTGHADTRGDPEKNQVLSERRADAVIQYLQKYCGVQPYRVLKSNAMGEEQQVGDTHSESGLAQNRRVVVRILTNKGLEGL